MVFKSVYWLFSNSNGSEYFTVMVTISSDFTACKVRVVVLKSNAYGVRR
jgi:hypothetical protein